MVLPGRTLSVAYGDSSPEGRALGRTGRFRPYRSTARRSQPISEELYALAKASPFRERWHGGAVTERVCFRDEPSQSPTATASSPFCRLAATSSPGRGKSFEGRALGKEGRSRPHSSTARRSQLINAKLPAPAKASPFRERWHGGAVTERVGFRKNPLSLAALDSSPEGRALGKEGKFRPHRSTVRRSQLINAKLSALGKTGRFRPHSSTVRRSQPISGKLYALAKASPFRERWHGGAVTERVAPR